MIESQNIPRLENVIDGADEFKANYEVGDKNEDGKWLQEVMHAFVRNDSFGIAATKDGDFVIRMGFTSRELMISAKDTQSPEELITRA
ncbi:hypothetical protein PIB30_000539 [Stylosanthes scabra]|uniref:Uncharacterized protein n=1 Tax=Stylosanthes scabra TaxID=79078 RepID=A0ABU6W2K1_9FABA|nr:hypothetical protein [Stylosanthes scabra]